MPSEEDCMASSRRRVRMLADSLRADSVDWMTEMPSLALRTACE
jgi:hypothetical protein